MKAIYDSVCAVCKEKISAGEEIENYNKSWAHKKCVPGKETAKPAKEPEAKNYTVKLVDPFQESELIIGIVKNFAYKAVNHSRGITDISILKSKPEEFKQFEIDVMHTEKLFLECILRLRELHGIKSEYGKK